VAPDKLYVKVVEKVNLARNQQVGGNATSQDGVYAPILCSEMVKRTPENSLQIVKGTFSASLFC
jgi:hypothetical protein